MGSITNWMANELLDHVLNGAGAAYTPPATVYVALCLSDPGDTATDLGGGVECANASAYARTAIAWTAAASRVLDQNGLIDFPTASGGGWGTVTHWALCDTDTWNGGNCMAHGALNESKTINDGNDPDIGDSAIDVTISANEVSDYLANKLLDFAFRNQAFVQPATHIAACITSEINDNDTGTSITEPGAGAYARKEVADNGGASPTWDLASGQTVDNTHEIAFPTATATWGTIVAAAICDAATLGNMLWYDNSPDEGPVGNGDTLKFAIGTLDVTLN